MIRFIVLRLLSTLKLVMIALLTIISGILTMLSALVGKWLYAFVSHRLWGPGILWVSGVKLRVYGRENIIKQQPGIYLSNHASYFDIPALYRALTVTVYFVAKKELARVPFLGWAMWAAGIIFVDRGNREAAIRSMQKAGRTVRSGRCVVTFPEGTRTPDGNLQRFKMGTFVLAHQEQLPLIPCAVLGSRDILPRGGRIIRSGSIRVVIGQPVLPVEYAKLNPKQLRDLMENKVRALLADAVKY